MTYSPKFWEGTSDVDVREDGGVEVGALDLRDGVADGVKDGVNVLVLNSGVERLVSFVLSSKCVLSTPSPAVEQAINNEDAAINTKILGEKQVGVRGMGNSVWSNRGK